MLLLKEKSEMEFESKFKNLKKKYDSSSSNSKENLKVKKIEDYLDLMYNKKEKWAFCYTHQYFTAGLYIFYIY